MALPKLNTGFFELDLPYTKKRIQYRPFVVGEQKILMHALESKDDKQVLLAIKKCIESCTNNSIDVNQLPLFELEYLFLNIRMRSVGEKTKVVLRCEECLADNEVELDLRQTEFYKLNDSKDDVIFITDKIAVRMKLPSIEIAQRLNLDDLSQEKQTEVLFALTVNCIDAVLDEENEYKTDELNLKEVEEFVNSLNSDQFLKIQQWFENLPILKLKVEHKCSNCSTDINTSLQGIASFF